MSIHQRTKSLSSRADALRAPAYQLTVLNNRELPFPKFDETLASHGIATLTPSAPEILQVNIGKKCNQTCAHCHVDAGPDRKEIMHRDHLELCLEILRTHRIPKVDITGGAPELHPDFRWFVEECAAAGVHVMDRCNLTILVSHPRYSDLPEFFATHGVQVIASLPYFTKVRTDSQRGSGVFDDSIRALQMLNDVAYGIDDSGLILDLVYNPTGAFLPSSQVQLEKEFKMQLQRRYGIVFNNLYAIANMPISRFLEYLIASENYTEYMTALIEAFNPATVQGLMCRNTLSVSWDGFLYDCDFNQMLDLKVASPSNHLSRFDVDALQKRPVVTNQHCYGCTAGSGSSCGGKIMVER